MTTESDPNVIYGGDPDESLNISYASIGEQIVADLKIGANKKSFVSCQLR